MKSLIATVATLFAVSAFAAEPAKKEEKKASEPVKVEKKAEAKKADAEKKASDAKK
jgi:hypothetical protein